MAALNLCVTSNVKNWMKVAFQIPLTVSNPLLIYRETFGALARLRGKGFQIELEHDEFYSMLFVNVKQCFFHKFFTLNGASFLVRFCVMTIYRLKDIHIL